MLGEKHGLYSTYDTYGRITKKVFYINGKPHGLVTLRTGSDEILYQYYNQGKYITEQVQQRVTDITKITDYEKTILALELGLLL
jgi:antitoxin component YwqK of YwqJK toxin-antitoxin module